MTELNLDNALSVARRYHQSGCLAEAEAMYRRILALDADHADALHLLGVLGIQSNRADAAITLIEKAISRNPDNADYYANLGMALRSVDRTDEALRAYDDALRLDPRHANAHYNLGAIHEERGHVDEAIACLERSVALAPEAVEVQANLAALLLEAGRPDAALSACERCLELDPGSRLAIGYKAMAHDQLGESDETRRLVGLDTLIRPMPLPVPAAYGGLVEFLAALSAHVESHPTLRAGLKGKATRGGLQTGELLEEPRGPVADLEPIINAAVREYLAAIPHDVTHPWLAQRPRRWQLTVWGVVLQAEGRQAPHMHGDGWVSGVCYVSLPDEVKRGDAGEAGYIEFGRPPQALQRSPEPQVRLIEPREGLMVLFPSYVHHRTIPFASSQPRVSIAFDAMALEQRCGQAS